MFKATITITADEPSDKLTELVEQAGQSVTDIVKKAGTVTLTVRSGRYRDTGAGGAKGTAIVAARQAHPDWTPRQIADHVGCSTARVYKALKAIGASGQTPAKATPAKAAPTPVKSVKATAKSAKATTPAKATTKRAPAKAAAPKPEHANPADALDAALGATAKAS